MTVKKYILLATLSGLLLGLSWPTYGWSFLIFFALAPLLYVVVDIHQSTTKKKGLKVYLLSFWAFFVWNMISTYWLFNASVLGGSIAMIFNTNAYALLMVLFRWMFVRNTARATYLFWVVSWLSYEKINLEWELSWPWLTLGNVFAETPHWVQWYEYTGVFGGSLWILVINLLIHHFILAAKDKTVSQFMGVRILLCIALPIALSLAIYLRVSASNAFAKVVVLQPNIDPYDQKYTSTNVELLERAKGLSDNYMQQNPDFVLSPEGYFDEGLGLNLNGYFNDALYRSLVEYAQSHPQTAFLNGVQAYKIYPRQDKKPTPTANRARDGRWFDVFNSAMQTQHDQADQFYHKSKLVPGVEFMPYKQALEPLVGRFLLDFGGTIATRGIQKNRTVFHNKKNQQTAPMVCYESIYGEFTTGFVRNGAQFLSIITNDAWWGNTEGHRQLLAYAKLRAIENRRAIARSANTGISAFINAKGEIEKSLPYLTSGALMHSVELRDEITFYATFGDYIPRWAGFFTFILLLLGIRGQKK